MAPTLQHEHHMDRDRDGGGRGGCRRRDWNRSGTTRRRRGHTDHRRGADRFGQRRELTGSRTLAAVGGRRQRSGLEIAVRTTRRELSVTGREYLSLADTVHVQLVDFDRAADVSTGPGD